MTPSSGLHVELVCETETCSVCRGDGTSTGRRCDELSRACDSHLEYSRRHMTIEKRVQRRSTPALAVVLTFTFLFAPARLCEAATGFVQTNLVSSFSGFAPLTDTNLKNPSGVALSPTGTFWVANQLTGTATVYDANGQPLPVGSPLVVTI